MHQLPPFDLQLFLRLFQPGVPTALWGALALAAAALLLGAAVYGSCTGRRARTGRGAVWGLAGEYVLLIFCITVFCRTPGCAFGLEWRPLWSLTDIEAGAVETLYEKLNNVLLFMPLGALMGLLRLRPWWGAALLGPAISLAVELTQLLTRTGVCETDDLLCNSLGYVLAWAPVYLAMSRFRRKKGEHAHV